MFFCAFLKEHGALMEKQASHEPLLKSLHYLLLISEVDDTEISKICLEYWNALAADLYRESPFSSTASPLFMSRWERGETVFSQKAAGIIRSSELSKFLVTNKDVQPELQGTIRS